jgi:hypothetical protein
MSLFFVTDTRYTIIIISFRKFVSWLTPRVPPAKEASIWPTIPNAYAAMDSGRASLVICLLGAPQVLEGVK